MTDHDVQIANDFAFVRLCAYARAARDDGTLEDFLDGCPNADGVRLALECDDAT